MLLVSKFILQTIKKGPRAFQKCIKYCFYHKEISGRSMFIILKIDNNHLLFPFKMVLIISTVEKHELSEINMYNIQQYLPYYWS